MKDKLDKLFREHEENNDTFNELQNKVFDLWNSSSQFNSQFEKGDTVVVEGELLATVLEVYKHVVKIEISDGTTGKVHKDDLIIVKKAI